jgi:hypothetical protein
MRGTKLICKYNHVKSSIRGRVIVQTASYWPLILGARFRSQVRLCEICSGQNGTETHFFPGFPFSVLFHQYEIIYQLDVIEYLFVFFQLDMFRAYTPIFRSNGCYSFFTYAAYGVLGVVRCRP